MADQAGSDRSQALPATDSDRASLTDLLIEVVGDAWRALHTEPPPGLLHSTQTALETMQSMKTREVEQFMYRKNDDEPLRTIGHTYSR